MATVCISEGDAIHRFRCCMRARTRVCLQSRLPRKVKKGYRRKAVEAAMALALANQSRKEHVAGPSPRGSCSTASDAPATTIDEGQRRAGGPTSSGRRRPGSRGVPVDGTAGHARVRTSPKVRNVVRGHNATPKKHADSKPYICELLYTPRREQKHTTNSLKLRT